MDQPKTFSKDELFTPTLQYAANFWALTAIQWQIINGINVSQVGIGASIGIFLKSIVELAQKFVNKTQVSLGDFIGFGVGIFLILVFVAIGRFLNRQRNKLKKKISDHLLSDQEVGI
ncbi:hypothetical protein [Mesorhizobium sp. 113-3-3]|uniref:hypothetical protein n=1 Tax=Mesorhizobium sp. 113-3-3 TaxID=2744516 RepID=UPI00192926D5|nr:hypothetical protein [Mesorhizobium sp. 113-3-3]